MGKDKLVVNPSSVCSSAMLVCRKAIDATHQIFGHTLSLHMLLVYYLLVLLTSQINLVSHNLPHQRSIIFPLHPLDSYRHPFLHTRYHVHHLLLSTHRLLCWTLRLCILHWSYPLSRVKVISPPRIVILFILVMWIIIAYVHPIMLLWFPWILCLFQELQVKLCLILTDDMQWLRRLLLCTPMVLEI